MSRGATARLFVAVDPPSEVCGELAAWARATAAGLGLRAGKGGRPPLRLLAAGALHLTLCFLGSRPVSEIDTIAGALSSCSTPVGELSVGAPLWLPPRRPRALAVEIHDDGGGLATLHAEVTRSIAAVSDWEPERRRFRAHVTLARLGAGFPWRGRDAEPQLTATPQLRFTPAAVVLYRSWLSPGGASYEPLVSRELAPG
ncbi:MAG: RNA 2',3'-cyclic phosphodiesterase [Actinobacteria bacterium]|nr:MAG: RNA 2',3'-cyclic phosphodiesterase [Actinomycetota bacterium]